MKGIPWHRPETQAHRISLAIGLALLGAAACWMLGLPGVGSLPAWFYLPVGPRALDPTRGALLVLAVGPLSVAGFRLVRRSRAAGIVLLVLAGLAAQVAVLSMDRGTLLARMEQGHGEFIRIAHERRGEYLATMRDYEALSASGALGAFAPSKPPGTLSFYMLLDALADVTPIRELASPLAAEFRERPALHDHAAGAAAAALLMPLFTVLALLPIFFVARRLGGTPEDGVAAALLYLTGPGILLISYHADGALFPLLTMLVVGVAVAARRQADRRKEVSLLVLAGLAFGVGIWCNFSTLPLVGFLGILFVGLRAEAGDGVRRAVLGGSIDVALVVLGALVLLTALWAGGLFAQPFVRFASALEHHRRWKDDAIGGVFGAVGALEYWLWAGLPLLVVSLIAAGASIARAFRWTMRSGDGLVIATLAVHLVMAVFTGCVEAARLWLWVTPLFAVGAARMLRERAPTGAPEQLWVQLACSQFALTLVMRFCQPW